ncbi:MAG: hypothetical protein HC936_02315 [Leptolyngbyaceae cyanobacterium SU_3_3]|nr:hypothetical protein [Leptolyngbyaceae cyanobacterium SU_3_3]
MQRQVNAEVLSRLTRQTVNVQFNSVRRHPIAALLRSSRPDREKHPFSTHQIPDKPNSLVQQQWLHRLSQRIQHSIEFPLLHRVNWQPSEPFQLVEKDQIQPWATPLNGKTVSTELLLQLVNGKTSQPSSSAQPTKRDRPGVTSPTSVLRSLNIPQIQASQPRQILAPNAPTTSRTQPSMSSPVAIEPGEAIEAIVPEFRSHSYKLLQSESINTTATRPEEAQPNSIQTMESDLNILATNIKRILDEEARRYGIDV